LLVSSLYNKQVYLKWWMLIAEILSSLKW
jgi:hypothetical protein